MGAQNAMQDPRTAAAVYVVEATNDERRAMWREWSAEALAGGWGTPTNARVTWVQGRGGWMVSVGDLAGFPVNMTVTYEMIDGCWVLFWSPCSRVVDREMCESWLRDHVPAYPEHHTNAANFGHCLSHIRRMRTPAESSSL
jgi:hypothetical protein